MNDTSLGEYECVHETERALKCVEVGSPPEDAIWVPKSVVSDDSEVYKKGNIGELVVAEWFAEKEGLA